jgi:hypothetical protein
MYYQILLKERLQFSEMDKTILAGTVLEALFCTLSLKKSLLRPKNNQIIQIITKA